MNVTCDPIEQVLNKLEKYDISTVAYDFKSNLREPAELFTILAHYQ